MKRMGSRGLVEKRRALNHPIRYSGCDKNGVFKYTKMNK